MKECENLFENWEMLDETVMFGAYIPIKAHKDLKSDNRHWNINTFLQIGWPDPFPKPLPSNKFTEDFKVSFEEIIKNKKTTKLQNSKEILSDHLFQAKQCNLSRRIRTLRGEIVSDSEQEEP